VKLRSQLRILLVLGAMLMAFAPLSAFAGTAADEAANREARCKLVLQGVKVSGNLRFDQCTKYAAAGPVGEVRALQQIAGPKATCPHPGKALTGFEKGLINGHAIAKRKALKKNLPEPTTTQEIAGLEAC
jgi:hypothetical protein